MEAFEEVSDSLCVPQYNADGEERVILFLKMAPGKAFFSDLVAKIKGAIRKALSARHVPALVLETADIPVRKSQINQIISEATVACKISSDVNDPSSSAVHHQWQEGGSGGQAGDLRPGGGTEGGLFQPRFTGPLQEHS